MSNAADRIKVEPVLKGGKWNTRPMDEAYMKSFDRHVVAERSTRAVTASFAYNAGMTLAVLKMLSLFLSAVLAEHRTVMGSPTRTKMSVNSLFVTWLMSF